MNYFIIKKYSICKIFRKQNTDLISEYYYKDIELVKSLRMLKRLSSNIIIYKIYKVLNEIVL